MEFLFFWSLGVGTLIAYFAIKQDKIMKGFKPNAKDGDKDGLVQDGTRWQRKVKK
jgi:hypothetical protein